MAAFGTLVAIVLSFGVVIRGRRRQRVVLPQPRQWVAAQAYVPESVAPVSTVDSQTARDTRWRTPASLTQLRANEERGRRQAALLRAGTTQPDAA